jgi:regulator of protease activity HflC (stomatin/prohibitin superfamily)
MSNSDAAGGAFLGTLVAWLVIFAIIGGMWGCPNYQVYEQRLAGEAELQRAESSRRIAVLEAQAKFDASTKLAEAEVERAKGVAAANAIIGKSLEGNEAYLHYLWINELAASGHVIYVPTEANLPIMEATRLAQPSENK